MSNMGWLVLVLCVWLGLDSRLGVRDQLLVLLGRPARRPQRRAVLCGAAPQVGATATTGGCSSGDSGDGGPCRDGEPGYGCNERVVDPDEGQALEGQGQGQGQGQKAQAVPRQGQDQQH